MTIVAEIHAALARSLRREQPKHVLTSREMQVKHFWDLKYCTKSLNYAIENSFLFGNFRISLFNNMALKKETNTQFFCEDDLNMMW